jgi:hypothetical protein
MFNEAPRIPVMGDQDILVKANKKPESNALIRDIPFYP